MGTGYPKSGSNAQVVDKPTCEELRYWPRCVPLSWLEGLDSQ